MIEIRPATKADHAAMVQIIRVVFDGGDTYPYPPDMTDDEILHAWIDKTQAAYVATEDGEILGTYYLKPNQPGLGSHVCNAGYIVGPTARGRGVAARCASTHRPKLASWVSRRCSTTWWSAAMRRPCDSGSVMDSKLWED